jgi:hypothetical protein
MVANAGAWRMAGALLVGGGVVAAAAAWQAAWLNAGAAAAADTPGQAPAATAAAPVLTHVAAHRAAQQHAAPPSQAPATTGSDGLEGLPTPLRAYARSGDRLALFDPLGHARPTDTTLAATPWAWLNLARRLQSTQALHVMRWLLEQGAHDAVTALARFASACQEAGVELPLSEADAERMAAAVGAGTLPPDLMALADLAAQDRLPAALRDGLRSRLGADPALAQQWASLMAQSANAGQAHQMAQLADDARVWQLAFEAPLQRGATLAREGALSALAVRDSPQWLEDLLRFAPGADMPLALDLAARWAESALTGPRMVQLAQLASAGAFAGDRAPLLLALLRHAQDQNAAAELATQMGLTWLLVR